MFQRSTYIRVVVVSFIVCLVAGTGIAQTGAIFDLLPNLPEGYDWKYNPDNGHYYAYVSERQYWPGAMDYSANLGGYLVTITSKEENDWLTSTFASSFDHNKYSIGLYRGEDDRWRWVNGEVYVYNNWGDVQFRPEEKYVYVFSDENSSSYGKWGDNAGLELCPFIIEIGDPNAPIPTPTPIVDGNLVGYWNFDEGSGAVANDSSRNDIDGTLTGAQWGTGYVNGGMYFDGADDYVTLGNDPKISDLSAAYSIAFWVKTSGERAYHGIYRRAENSEVGPSQMEIYINPEFNGLVTSHNRSNEFQCGAYWPIIDFSEWHHITVTWDVGYGWKVYYNGEPQEPMKVFYENYGSPAKGGNSYIGIGPRGTWYDGEGDSLLGFLDEFKIYDIALTQEQVLLVYNDSPVQTTPTPTPIITPTPTPTPENWSSLNGSTLEDNLLAAGAPAGYTQGKVSMTSIPEGAGSDGSGMEIKLAPGQGAFISSLKEFDSPSLMHLSGQFKASNKEAAIALVGLNSPIDGQIGYANVRADEVPVHDYRQFNLIYAPPSGKVQYAIQAVNNPFSTISSTVWVDNIRVEPFEPIVDGEPVALQVDGNFEGGLEELLVNINDDDGTVLPFFESITDIAIRMSLEPSNIAANLGTICLNLADQFPFRLLGQVSVKRDSLPGGGMTAMVLTNGFQNLGVFRKTDDLLDVNSVQDELLIIGGDFTVNNPDIPLSVFVQVGGPGAEVSVVVDDLTVLKQ